MNNKERLLFSPGPVPCEYNIKIDFSHRSKEFLDLFKETKKMLSDITGYNNIIFTQGSASSAVDVVSNLFEGKKVLVLNNGTFGSRMSRMIFNVNGEVFEAKSVKNAISFLKSDIIKYDVFMMVHFETSTSTFNDTKVIERICKERGIKLVVDCVSSFPFYSLPKADFIILSSSKQLRGLPAMGIVLYNPRAVPKHQYARTDYLDFKTYVEYSKKNQTPHTSLIPQMISLNKSLKSGEIMDYVNNIHEKCLILTKRRMDKVIGDSIGPVLTFRVKNLEALQKHLEMHNIIPYYNASYMGGIIQFSMFNYKQKETYEILDRVLKAAEVKGWL